VVPDHAKARRFFWNYRINGRPVCFPVGPVRVALNRLSEKGTWNFDELKAELDDALVEITGFSMPEIDQAYATREHVRCSVNSKGHAGAASSRGRLCESKKQYSVRSCCCLRWRRAARLKLATVGNTIANAISKASRLQSMARRFIGPLGSMIAQFIRDCERQATELKYFPADEIARSVALNDTQANALSDALHTADEVSVTLARTCPRDVPADPVGRLDAVEHSIDSVEAALDDLQPALKALYGSLADDQKARLVRTFAVWTRAAAVSRKPVAARMASLNWGHADGREDPPHISLLLPRLGSSGTARSGKPNCARGPSKGSPAFARCWSISATASNKRSPAAPRRSRPSLR
jgi:hypothetical protein